MYSELSHAYDALTLDVDYASYAEYLKKHLASAGIESGIILDLACGTGTLSFLLAEAGYKVIGVDISEDMLAEAQSKTYDCRAKIPPVFIRQDMRRLDLYGTVRACVCTLDAVNHITKPAELLEVFRKVSLFTEPGGIFLFDINSREKLEWMDGHAFTDETDDVFCVWQVASGEKDVYQFEVDVFRKHGVDWRRGSEEYYERAYDVDEITEMLENSGFGDVKVYGNSAFSPPVVGEQRIWFCAKKI